MISRRALILGVLSRIKRIGYEGFEANVLFVQSR